jgi:nucleoside-diphosphate-sugar epimerase
MTEQLPGVLVTGGSGFIGSHVVRALADKSYRVCSFDLRPPTPEAAFVIGPAAKSVSFELGGVDDQARLFDVIKAFSPTYIVHLATIIDPPFLATHRQAGFRVDVGGTVNVLEAMCLFDLERLVFFSSVGVLPPRPLYEPVNSSHPLVLASRGPSSGLYGAYKAAGEVLCYAYEQDLGVDFRVIRPSAVYGVGMNQYVGPIKKMVEASVRGEAVHFVTGGAHARDFTHAEDLASLVAALLAGPADTDRIFFGATGQPLVSGTQIAEVVREVVAGSDVTIGESLADDERAIAASRARLSIENARTQLGWEPKYSSIRDGVARYAEHYREFIASQA